MVEVVLLCEQMAYFSSGFDTLALAEFWAGVDCLFARSCFFAFPCFGGYYVIGVSGDI
jgi:hypothetical protein